MLKGHEGTITSHRHLNVGQSYRIFRDGVHIDTVTLHHIDDTTGYLVRGEFDELETVELRDWVDEHTIVPDNGVPIEDDEPDRRSWRMGRP